MEPAAATSGRAAALGRYLLFRRLSADGEGEVHAAFDPELNRRVALKLLRETEESTRETLLREAQALARLSHPHVITIHDVGTEAGQVFLAMEYLDGGTLAAWLAEAPRSWKQILALFLQAGNGLRAAHAAGLADQCFGPEGVLLGKDGRARLISLRCPGAVSLRAAAAEDVRRLCSALDEALRHRAAPPGPPAWLLWRLFRWMRDPALAPDLGAVLRSLSRDPRTAWRRRLILLGTVVGIGALTLLAQHIHRPMCRDAERRIADTWDEGRRQQIREAFRRSGTLYAHEAFAAVDRSLSTFTTAWAEQHRAVCEDTRVRRVQPEEVLDLRIGCLERQRVEARTLIEVFASADRATVERAAAVTQAATDLESCRDVQALKERPEPRDARVRVQVQEIRTTLVRVEALGLVARYREALDLAERTSAQAIHLPYRPIHADALYAKARILSLLGRGTEAEQAYLEALWAAEAGHYDNYVALAYTALVYVAANDLGRMREAHEFAHQAAAALHRCAGCEDLWPLWHRRMGTLLLSEERPQEALPHFLEEIALRRGQKDAGQQLDPYNNLGLAYLDLGLLDEALESFQRARNIRAQSLGPSHPDGAQVLGNLAEVFKRQGRFGEQLAAARSAFGILERAHGLAHPRLGEAMCILGGALARTGQGAEGRRRLAEGLNILERTRGLTHIILADCLEALGEALLEAGEADRAREKYARSLALLESQLGPDSPRLAPALAGLGRSLLDIGMTEVALAPLRRAARLAAARPGLEAAGAEARFALARALGRTERTESITLAIEARAMYAKLGAGYQRERAEVDGWMKRTGPGGAAERMLPVKSADGR